ncbi:TPA: hypothetical protein HA265_01005 [Candidatus Woesearchaeota archaeon]|nr:hypothetical protein [Candidatus Woesearchaeota archaeon]
MAFRGKRAISPLIAAVLLVVVTVSIGAAVFSLIQNYMAEGKQDIKEGQEEIRCGRDVGIELFIVNNTYICNATDPDDDEVAIFHMIISNTGTRDVDQAQLRVFFEGKVFQNSSILNDTLEMGESQVVNVTYSLDTYGGEFRSAQVIPRISIPGVQDYAFCTDNAWNVEAMNSC